MTKIPNVINDSFVFFEFIFTIELFFTFFLKEFWEECLHSFSFF